MKKVVIVTGTSSGVGFSLALKLAKEGHCVYATMRNLEKQTALVKAAEAASAFLSIKKLEVQDTVSVNQCIKEVMEEQGRIDCLINNAGIGFIKSTEQATENEIQHIIDTNFMGMVRCVKAVLPHMRKAKKGHIINISSIGGLVGQPFNEIYCASKFAMEGYTESMATYLQPVFNIKFSLVEPGGIISEFANNVLARLKDHKQEANDEYAPLLQQYISAATKRLNDKKSSVYQEADEVANCIIAVMNSENPPLRIRSSEWANTLCHLKTQPDPDGTRLVKQVHEYFM